MAGLTTLPTLQMAQGIGGGSMPLLNYTENFSPYFLQLKDTASQLAFSFQQFNLWYHLSFSKAAFLGLGTLGSGAIDSPDVIKVFLGLYTRTGDTFSLHLSGSADHDAQAIEASGSNLLAIQFSPTLLTPNQYYLGAFFSTTRTNTATAAISYSLAYNTTNNYTLSSNFLLRATHTVTQSALPNSASTSDFTWTGAEKQPYILLAS